MKRLLAIILAVISLTGLCFTASAKSDTLAPDAYASIVTASDFQHLGNDAYDRFGRLLGIAKADGLSKIDSVLVGGDYTMVLFDNAVPGISKIRHAALSAFPETVPESIVCIQGNHDNPKEEFAETGFYDMGAYKLYVINEDSFPWKQSGKSDKGVKELAANIETALDSMINSGDSRPVIFLTHVPLHYTERNGGGDNLYSSYVFDVINEKAEKLDIIFLFGHNHSSAYDDYIGGSINYMKPGDNIWIPVPEKGKNAFVQQKLNFIYANCGYIGYSDNTLSETSTNVLTMGIIQFTPDKLVFIKYSDDGVCFREEAARKNTGSAVNQPSYPALDDNCPCHSENGFIRALWSIRMFFCKLFNIETYCTCGKVHA